MNFLVVGVGALGSVFLSFLTRAGYRAVGLIRPNRCIKKIRVDGIWGEFEQEVKIIDSISKIDFKPDIVILSVKSYNTEEALQKVASFIDGAYIMLAQNGYGNYEKAVNFFGKERVILSRVIFGAKLLSQGHVRVTVCGDDVVIGNPDRAMDKDFLIELSQILSKAGIPTRYEDEVYKFLWDKILYNCCLNPLGALFEVNYGKLVSNQYTMEVIDNVIEEAFNVLLAKGIETFWKSAEEYREYFYKRLVPPTAEHLPSMLEDIKKGRTKIDALNGAIVKLAKEVSLEVTTNELMVRLVKAKENFLK
ncbi:MAG: ketopantoate reductase family protein [Aquificaceae bacterium]